MSAPDKPQPAQPVLASTLFAIARRSGNHLQSGASNDPGTFSRTRIATGIKAIDDLVLDGGFEAKDVTLPGVVAGIAIERGDGADIGTLLLHHILATYLQHPAPRAFILDPTGAFNPPLLHQLLTASMTSVPNQATDTNTTPSAAAVQAMQSASLMRVQDFEQLMDALAEADHTLSTPRPSSAAPEDHTKTEIPDSDASSSSSISSPSADQTPPLILLPALHTLLKPQLQANPPRGLALAAHLQARLRALARTHGATALLFNATVGPGLSPGPRDDADASAFSAHGGVWPALGRAYAAGLDVALLVARWRRADAPAWSVEVLADRAGGRRGRWAVVAVGRDGVGLRRVEA